jgi:hypothetical protein
MPASVKWARLKGQLSAHRKAVNALAAATRQLHQALDGILGAADGPAPPSSRRRKDPPPPRPGEDGVSKRARNRTPSRRGATDPPTDPTRTAALERHWGNLF